MWIGFEEKLDLSFMFSLLAISNRCSYFFFCYFIFLRVTEVGLKTEAWPCPVGFDNCSDNRFKFYF